ncbi:hypothetical protein BH367_18330 [Klebsiella pneumoniae]|nr:hypothetical protein CRN19_16340 [Klebsiella pneumoniae]OXU74851.1 hypothetical protein CEB43_13440 [Klebsiella pneumoniae subsp. pneumoniae]ATO24172.1 hypothetical protein CR230_16135 [Klebsiella pneumoniae]AWO39540.1 hypothetical protein DLJ66_02385 [Klebsiella pneumoniae]AWO44443.1 hypothetical protein DLJ67_00275 [Klebsiella pneumoniae]
MKIDNHKEPDSIPELMKKSGEMSVGRRSWRAIIPSLAADCIAIFVKQFLQTRFGGCCLAAENNSLLWPVNGLAGILLAAARRPGYLIPAGW